MSYRKLVCQLTTMLLPVTAPVNLLILSLIVLDAYHEESRNSLSQLTRGDNGNDCQWQLSRIFFHTDGLRLVLCTDH